VLNGKNKNRGNRGGEKRGGRKKKIGVLGDNEGWERRKMQPGTTDSKQPMGTNN